VTPANEIGHPELGHLAVGTEADLAIFKVLRGEFSFVDCGYAKMHGAQKLECQFTLRAGEVVYDPGGLSMPEWTAAPPEYWQIRWS
jgi:dihydroorotase